MTKTLILAGVRKGVGWVGWVGSIGRIMRKGDEYEIGK